MFCVCKHMNTCNDDTFAISCYQELTFEKTKNVYYYHQEVNILIPTFS
jgi:hypothetical protein